MPNPSVHQFYLIYLCFSKKDAVNFCKCDLTHIFFYGTTYMVFLSNEIYNET